MKSTTKNIDFYCNQKFWWLTVDLGNFTNSSCCAATPRKIDINWIKNNPGKIFNDPVIQQERKQMIENQPVESCRDTCWRPESDHLSSRRIIMQGDLRTHSQLESDPEILNIMIGTDCNMTCVYCCKHYSTAWARDVASNSYNVNHTDDRFVISDKDRTRMMLSQKDLKKSQTRYVMSEELQLVYRASGLKEIQISGGEPFLYLDLSDILKNIPSNVSVRISSGLGVDEKRFSKEISKLPENVTLMISVENIGPAYEFTRYGNTWKRFLHNIKTIESSGISYNFNATVSNITLPGLLDFIQFAQDKSIHFSPCTNPDFLSLNILDDFTKKEIKQNIDQYPDFVKESLEIDPTDQQIKDFRSYIIDYSSRRSLDLGFLPRSMIAWIQQ